MERHNRHPVGGFLAEEPWLQAVLMADWNLTQRAIREEADRRRIEQERTKPRKGGRRGR